MTQHEIISSIDANKLNVKTTLSPLAHHMERVIVPDVHNDEAFPAPALPKL